MNTTYYNIYLHVFIRIFTLHIFVYGVVTQGKLMYIVTCLKKKKKKLNLPNGRFYEANDEISRNAAAFVPSEPKFG